MGLTSFVLRYAVPVPKIEQYSRYLFVGPHPDDIEIGAGATAAKLSSAGKTVCFLVCTDGRYGDGFLPKNTKPETVAELRKKEAIRSAAVLGISDVRFLGLSDGGFYSLEELETGIARVIGDFCPDVIFAPDDQVKSECHADHRNVGSVCRKLAEFAPYEGIMQQYGAGKAPVHALALYMTADCNCVVPVTKDQLERQKKAIFDSHVSQFPVRSQEAKSIQTYLRLRSLDFGLRALHPHGEGFRVLGRTQMHCLPEAWK